MKGVTEKKPTEIFQLNPINKKEFAKK